MAAALLAMESILGNSTSPLRLTRKGRRDPWLVRSVAVPKKLNIPQREIEFTVRLDSATVGSLYVLASAFSQGGKNVARKLSHCLVDAIDASHYPEEDWRSGVVFLSRIPLSDHKDPATGAVDMDRVLNNLMADLSKQSGGVLESLLHSLRDKA